MNAVQAGEQLGEQEKTVDRLKGPNFNGRLLPRFKADDIKHGGSLAMSDQQIADIPVERVYEWVRTGAWKQRDFKKWLKTLRVIE